MKKTKQKQLTPDYFKLLPMMFDEKYYRSLCDDNAVFNTALEFMDELRREKQHSFKCTSMRTVQTFVNDEGFEIEVVQHLGSETNFINTRWIEEATFILRKEGKMIDIKDTVWGGINGIHTDNVAEYEIETADYRKTKQELVEQEREYRKQEYNKFKDIKL